MFWERWGLVIEPAQKKNETDYSPKVWDACLLCSLKFINNSQVFDV